MAKETLYIGIDLGTFRSVMVSSASHEVEELTVIGTPKDPVARNFLKRDVLFGEEALKNRLALNLYRPSNSVSSRTPPRTGSTLPTSSPTSSACPTPRTTTAWSP